MNNVSSYSAPLAWPSDLYENAIDEPILESPTLQKPEPKTKDGGLNYVW